MRDSIRVTVYCLTYNHQDYIEQTIKGFVMQETSFKVKFIIHDDASEDKTPLIIRKYEKLYPDKIIGIYQTENQYSKKESILLKHIAPLAEGEYISMCEGDDYWTDKTKLQRQVDELDAHPSSFICVHKTEEIFENNIPTQRYYPDRELKSGLISQEDFLRFRYGFHTSSYMVRLSEWINYITYPPSFKKIYEVGDVPYLLFFGALGDVIYINKVMSRYRRGTPYSWSVNHVKKTEAELAKHASDIYETYIEFDSYTKGRFTEICKIKEAAYLSQKLLLTETAKNYFKKETRSLFYYLSVSQKLYLIMACFMPRLCKTMYFNRITTKSNSWLNLKR